MRLESCDAEAWLEVQASTVEACKLEQVLDIPQYLSTSLPRKCLVARAWLTSQVGFAVETPLAALRAVEVLGLQDSDLGALLLKHAAKALPLSCREEWLSLSTEVLRQLLSQDVLHTGGDEAELLRAVLAFSETRPGSLGVLLGCVRLPFVRMSTLRTQCTDAEMDRLRACPEWTALGTEAVAAQLGKRKFDADTCNPRLRKRACYGTLPKLSAADVATMLL